MKSIFGWIAKILIAIVLAATVIVAATIFGIAGILS